MFFFLSSLLGLTVFAGDRETGNGPGDFYAAEFREYAFEIVEALACTKPDGILASEIAQLSAAVFQLRVSSEGCRPNAVYARDMVVFCSSDWISKPDKVRADLILRTYFQALRRGDLSDSIRVLIEQIFDWNGLRRC